MTYTDMHCHILPGVDDGPKTMKETVQVIAEAWRQGVRCMIATPHFHPGRYVVDSTLVYETTSAPEETTTEPAQEETTLAQEETATEQAPEETTSVQEETTSVSEEETIDEPAPNLLKNPEWESGAVGWIVTSGNQETEFEGHSCLSSTNSQSITVTDEMVGKVLKFSGSIATASSDSTQEAIGLMITSYKDDDTVIATDTVIEEGKDLTPHEVLVDITPDTAYVRVSVTIWKQGTKNIFNFSDLRLEETDTSFVRE